MTIYQVLCLIGVPALILAVEGYHRSAESKHPKVIE